MANKDENKVLHLYPIDYPFETLVTRVEKKKLILNPDFQRTYKWDKDGNERSSSFIESCLMRIPIPACYFAENQDSYHLVIDGVQRITTIQRFFNDDFKLEGLSAFKELEGKKFSQLGAYKSELENTTMRCIILRKENPKHLVNEIFARLNQGAVQLSKQEIRHAIYPGSLDNLLIELSENKIIKKFGLRKDINEDNLEQELDKRKNSRETEEMILRFFAMQSDLSDYQSNLSKYFDKYMEKNQNISKEQIQEKQALFTNTLDKCLNIFGEENIFRNTAKQQARQSLVIYDLLMWSFKNHDKEVLLKNKKKIENNFNNLIA